MFSDHALISIEIDFRNFKRGRGYWKFNNSLLKDLEYVSVVKKSIRNVIKTYCSNDFIDIDVDEASPEQLQSIPCTINDQLLLDMIQLEIRGNTIKYASAKKKGQIKYYGNPFTPPGGHVRQQHHGGRHLA